MGRQGGHVQVDELSRRAGSTSLVDELRATSSAAGSTRTGRRAGSTSWVDEVWAPDIGAGGPETSPRKIRKESPALAF